MSGGLSGDAGRSWWLREALRAIIQRIECTFEPTDQRGGGHGKKNTRFAKVTIYPIVGDAAHFRIEADNVLRATRATSHM